MNRHFIMLLAVFVACAFGPAAQAQTYIMTNLGAPLLTGPFAESTVFGINDSGTVIGYSTTNGDFYSTFSWQNGVVTTIPASTGYDTNITAITPTGINSTGQIVGLETVNFSGSDCFVYQNGVSTAFPVADGNIAEGPSPAGINNAGLIVGGAGVNGFAFLYNAGTLTNLGFLPGGTFSKATCINNASPTEIAGSSNVTSGGSHATLWKNGVAYDLGTLGGPTSVAYGINDKGQIVGQSDINVKDANGNYEYRAFLWTPTTPNATTGTLQNLGLLTGQSNSAALAINNSGTIVGDSIQSSPNGGAPAFVWDSVHGLRNLQSLVAPASLPASAVLESAVSINTQGQIVGNFSTGSFGYGYVLTPTTTAGVTIASLSFNPTTVATNGTTTGTITLTGAAPTGGAVVTLTENGTVRGTITMPAGQTVGTFSLPFTGYVAGTETEVISYNGSQATATVTVTAPVVATLLGVSLNPSAVTGGQSITGTVTLSAAAPTGGALVTLSSDLTAATVPASVTVAAGATSATFTVTTTAVTTLQTADISASYAGKSQSASADISPPVAAPALSSVTVSPTSVVGGAANATGTVTLTAAATATTTVTLTSSNTAALTVPASVTIAAGAKTATFTATSKAVTAATTVTVTAAYNGVSKTAIETVTPAPPAAPVVTTRVVSASQINLYWTAVPGATTYVIYRSTVSGTGRTMIGQTTGAAYADTPLQAATRYYYVVSAGNANGATNSAEVSATTLPAAAALSSVTLSPTTVIGGAANATGTVTLTAAATATTTVTLTSSNTVALTVPASVTIAAGATTATFTATSHAVTAATAVTVTAASNGVSKTAAETVNPPAGGPAAPVVTTRVVSASQINLYWTLVPNATTYVIYRSTVSGTGRTMVGQTTGAAYADQSLQAGTRYYYVVSAGNANGATNSAEVSATTAPAAPVVTTRVVSASQINLYWTAVPGATTYVIYRSTTPGTGRTTIGQTTGVAYADTPLQGGTRYYYVVSAGNAGGATNSTEVSAITTAAASALSSVTLSPTTVIGGAANATGTVTLTAAATATTTVTLTSSNTAALTVPTNVTIAAGATTATFTATSHAVTVSTAITVTAAFNGVSKTAAETVNPPAGGPAAPQVTTRVVSASQINLYWTLVPNATTYVIYRSTVSGTGRTMVGQTTGAAYADQSLQAGTRYYYVVSAGNAGGATNSAEVSAITAPAAPVVTTRVVSASQINLYWTAVPGATTYVIYRSTVSGTGRTMIGQTTGGAYADTPLQAGTRYYYVVSAGNAGGATNSTEVSAITTAAPAALSSVTLSPTTVVGGAANATGTVTLTAAATATTTVTLTSSNTAALTVPASVTIAAGATTATFTATSHAVTAATAVTVTAAFNGISKTAAETVNPPAVVVPTGLTFNPNPAYSSGQSTVILTLSGAAPTGGAVVTLTDNGLSLGQVTVPAGQTSLTFSLDWDTAGTYSMGATYNGTTVTTSVTVLSTSVSIVSLVYAPSTVKGGASAVGTVTLSAPAPSGGAYITLTGSVSYAFLVPAGQTTATYTQPTPAVTASTLYTFNAAYNGKSVIGTLTATP